MLVPLMTRKAVMSSKTEIEHPVPTVESEKAAEKSSPAIGNTKQFVALDGVRGLAILAVMVHHSTQLIPVHGPTAEGFRTFLFYGWTGVDLFFCLSGFLITHTLLESVQSKNYFSGFYGRRALRIFPLYYFVLTGILLLTLVVPVLSIATPIRADWKLYFVYLTNWLVLWKGTWRPNILGHFWSLGVEEQFYLVWPLCVFLFSKKNLERLAVALSLSALIIRIYWVSVHGPSQAVVMATITRMDSLLLGGFAAVLYRNSRIWQFRRWLLSIAALSLLLFAAGLIPNGIDYQSAIVYIQSAGFTMLAIGFSALILYLAVTDKSTGWIQRMFRFGPLVKLGKYSYGAYVYHVPVLAVYHMALILLFAHLPVWFGRSILVAALDITALIWINYFIAKVSYEKFESRFLKLKTRFAPRYESEPNSEKRIPDALVAEVAQ